MAASGALWRPQEEHTQRNVSLYEPDELFFIQLVVSLLVSYTASSADYRCSRYGRLRLLTGRSELFLF